MRYLLPVLILTGLLGCAVNPVTGNQDFVMISENQEIEMGREYNAQILKQNSIYPDQELQDYVQSIGESLASKSHRPNLIYRFTVLDSSDINAFALPGGYIFINRGLMSYLSSEEELAAVLAHEIGHVTARHSVRQYSQSQLMSIISTAIEIQAGSTAGDIANLASGAILSGYGREMELEADELGAEYIYEDGYSPQGMYEVLSVLKDQEVYSKKLNKQRGKAPVNYHGVFASHPSNDKRLQEILNGVGNLNKMKISKKIDSFNYADCAGHPKWYGEKEYLGNATKYKLHLLSNQPKFKLHSQLDNGQVANNEKSQGRAVIEVNEIDAEARNISDNMMVKVFNDRGSCLAVVKISDNIMEGVVNIPTGAWLDPLISSDISCVHGNPNVLTNDVGTSKLAQGPTAHTCLVEIEQFTKKVPKITAFDPPKITALK